MVIDQCIHGNRSTVDYLVRSRYLKIVETKMKALVQFGHCIHYQKYTYQSIHQKGIGFKFIRIEWRQIICLWARQCNDFGHLTSFNSGKLETKPISFSFWHKGKGWWVYFQELSSYPMHSTISFPSCKYIISSFLKSQLVLSLSISQRSSN